MNEAPPLRWGDPAWSAWCSSQPDLPSGDHKAMQRLGWTGRMSIGYDERGSPPTVREPAMVSRSRQVSRPDATRGVRDEPPEWTPTVPKPAAFRLLNR